MYVSVYTIQSLSETILKSLYTELSSKNNLVLTKEVLYREKSSMKTKSTCVGKWIFLSIYNLYVYLYNKFKVIIKISNKIYNENS